MIKTDQAATLRALQHDNVFSWPCARGKTVAISGGKGGVGKSAIAVDLAAAWGARGAKTLLVDGDLGMADLNLLLGLAPNKSMLDLLSGVALEDVLASAHGIDLLPGLNGSHQLANLPSQTREAMLDELADVSQNYEQVVIDTAAGIDMTTCALAASANEVIIVATPEPLSLADAYSAIKVLSIQHRLDRLFLVANEVKSKVEADRVIDQLKGLVDRFLDVELSVLPHVPYDPMVPLAGASGVPLVLSHPDSPAARAITRIARLLDSRVKEIIR